MIKLLNISKRFKKNTVLNSLNIELPSKGLVYLTGENGAGKTTLLNILSLNDLKFEGGLYFDDIDIKKISKREIQNLKRDYISYVYQKNNLFNFLKKEENANFDELLKCQKIKYDKKDSLKINTQSEGQQAIITLRNSLKSGKKIYILDEIFSSLDEKNQNLVYERIKELKEEALVIVVSHINKLKEDADIVIHLKKHNESNYLSLNDNLSFDKNVFVTRKKLNKFPFKLLLKSFMSNSLFKLGFLFVSLICLCFSITSTVFFVITPNNFFSSEIINLPSVDVDENLYLHKEIKEKFNKDMNQKLSLGYIYKKGTTQEFKVGKDYFLLDEKIKDSNIHLNNEYFNVLKDVSLIDEVDDLFIKFKDKTIDVDKVNIVIDDNIKNYGFYVGSSYLKPKETSNYIYNYDLYWDNTNHYADYYLANNLTNPLQFINLDYVKENFPLVNVDNIEDNIFYVDKEYLLTKGNIRFVDRYPVDEYFHAVNNYNDYFSDVKVELLVPNVFGDSSNIKILVSDKLFNEIYELVKPKKSYILRLNQSNRSDFFNFVNKKYIYFNSNPVYMKDDLKRDKIIEKKLNGLLKITTLHYTPKDFAWVKDMAILVMSAFILITIILITSITIIESRNIKLLMKSGLMDYEGYLITYGPYLVIFLFSLFIGKISSLFLVDIRSALGDFYWFFPYNILIYGSIFIVFTLISYLAYKKEVRK